MMIRFALCASLALASGIASSALVYQDWKTSVSDGRFAEAANWSGGAVPTGEDDVTRFVSNGSTAGADCRIRFDDLDSRSLALGFQLYSPTRFVLDLTDATYRLVGTETARGRDGIWYPFFLLVNRTSTAYALKMNFLSDAAKTDPVLTFAGGGLTFDSPQTGVAAVTLTGGRVDLVPGWEALGRSACNLEFGADPDLSDFELRLDGVAARFPSVSWFGRTAESRLTVTNGAQLTLLGDLKLDGEASAHRTLTVTGTGSSLVATNLASLTFGGNTSVRVSDGAVARLGVASGDWGLRTTVASAADRAFVSELTVAGLGTRVHPARRFIVAGNAGHDRAKLTVNGGYWGPEDLSAAGAHTTLVVGQGDGTGVVELNGGEIRLPVAGTSETDACCVVGPGTAALVVNDGLFVCGDLYLGFSGGAADAVQTFTLNGGTATVGRVYLGVSRTDTLSYQHPSVSLNGGVLATKQIFVHDGCVEAFKENARFSADGGTLQAVANQADWFYGFRGAELGAKGLTVDTLTWNPAIAQSFANKAGERGLFVKRGKGVLTLKSAAFDVARTVVEQGTLAFDADKTLATELVVTNGAVVSLVGAAVTRLTVDALTVTDGTLKLNPGDSVHVRSDRVDVTGLKVEFSSAAAEGDTCRVLTFDGDVTTNANVRTAMRRLALKQTVADGSHAAFEMAYDAASDQTTLVVSIRPDAAALADRTVWKGPSWNADGWSSGVPTAATVAVFDGTGAASVVVPETAEAGALAFSADSPVVFTGAGDLFLSGDAGAVRIDVTAGHPRFELPLASAAVVPTVLASGTSLELAAGFRDGGLAKTGPGCLTLAGTSTFTRDVSLGGGLNVVRSARALGSPVGQTVRLTSDTLAFDEPSGVPMEIPAKIRLAATLSPSNALVVKTETDVTFRDFGQTSGALIKRGVGKMTVVAGEEAPTILAQGHGTAKAPNGTLATATQTVFADDGTAPDLTTEYCGLNVAEGELAIVGTAAAQTVRANGSLLVGMNVAGMSTEAAQPRLTVDGVALSSAASGGHALLGFRAGSDGALATRPELKIVNGGTLSVPTLRVGTDSGFAGAFPTVTVTNGSLLCVNALQVSLVPRADPSACAAVWRAKDATVATTSTTAQWGHQLYGAVDLDFENVYWGGLNAPAPFTWNAATCGSVALRGGTFAMASVDRAGSGNRLPSDFTLAFDGTVWTWGDGDLTLPADAFLPTTHGHFEMRGTGLRVAPKAGQTFTTFYPFTGDGGFVNEGDGTAVFGAEGTCAFTGLLDIRAGVVDLTDAGRLASLAARGPGTLRGANVASLTLRETLAGESLSGVPTLDGVMASRVIVDLGHDETDPLDPAALANLTGARLAGGASVRRWKLSGTGVPRVSGRFAVEGDRVVLKEVGAFGFAIIVR